ncbi:hypothetical protein NVP1031O_072 [Vibrio phage 1.031.O._10N.261.46.F8]|nr:hypothetical protein NVP1031O_072 [Vibrio phage 1.031.O._10N.261.46.F8]
MRKITQTHSARIARVMMKLRNDYPFYELTDLGQKRLNMSVCTGSLGATALLNMVLDDKRNYVEKEYYLRGAGRPGRTIHLKSGMVYLIMRKKLCDGYYVKDDANRLGKELHNTKLLRDAIIWCVQQESIYTKLPEIRND